jgi:magnesium chelatase subunit D
VVVLSDGRANVSHTGDTPLDAAYREARALRDTGVAALVLDSETGPVHLGLAVRLANELGADYQHLDEREPTHGAQMIRAALPAVFDGTSAAPAGGR